MYRHVELHNIRGVDVLFLEAFTTLTQVKILVKHDDKYYFGDFKRIGEMLYARALDELKEYDEPIMRFMSDSAVELYGRDEIVMLRTGSKKLFDALYRHKENRCTFVTHRSWCIARVSELPVSVFERLLELAGRYKNITVTFAYDSENYIGDADKWRTIFYKVVFELFEEVGRVPSAKMEALYYKYIF